MNHDTTIQSVLFSELSCKPVVALFDQPQASSDGGALLLQACDNRLELSERLAKCLKDGRQSSKVQHDVVELVRQRLFGIACGYADGNDAARLKDDPIHKLLVGRDAVHGAALASQPTLSRFENGVDRKALYRMGEALAESVIERHCRRLRGKARRITVDLDPTDDPTHGAQQLTFFNSHYDTWCYLPTAGFISFDDEPDQYLVAYLLRPGNATASVGAVGLLRRLFRGLRQAFSRACLRVRLDGGFASPEIFEFLEAQGVEYVVAMGKNEVLKRHAEPLMARARVLAQASDQTGHVYGECRYAAGTWPHSRRVIIKAEQALYEDIYCARGEIENRIKELHHGLEIDRTSCTRFLANQLRVLLTAAAYVLMQELRWHARGTSCARAQVSTLRERLLKLGVWVQSSVRRIVLHLPLHTPYGHEWRLIARTLGAVPA